MNVLEKILEEIGATEGIRFSRYTELLIAVKDVEKIIRSHMDEDKDTNVPSNEGWIPVEERLPKDERMVLVTCQTKKGIRSTNRAYYDGTFWHGSGSMSSVTAWQNLPEPYKEEEN